MVITEWFQYGHDKFELSDRKTYKCPSSLSCRAWRKPHVAFKVRASSFSEFLPHLFCMCFTLISCALCTAINHLNEVELSNVDPDSLHRARCTDALKTVEEIELHSDQLEYRDMWAIQLPNNLVAINACLSPNAAETQAIQTVHDGLPLCLRNETIMLMGDFSQDSPKRPHLVEWLENECDSL